MVNYIVLGKSERVVTAVLQAIYSFTDAKCIVVGDHETRKLYWSMLCMRHIDVRFDGGDDSRAVALINEISGKMPHVALIPVDCEGIRLVNRMKAWIKPNVTPIPDPDTLEMMDDKWRFHGFCRTCDLNVPDMRFIGPKANMDFDAIAAELGVPFVLKPANLSGSVGVRIIGSKEGYLDAVERNNRYRFNSLIAQRYIEGEDIDLSLLAIHGRLSAFAIQQVKGSAIEFVDNACFEQMASAICSKSGFHGVMHLDARIEKGTGKIYLIEANPRFWASLTASVWCGLNFVAECIAETSRSDGARRLTAGRAYTRHPLLCPPVWTVLARDKGARGRLVRAGTFDLYSLGKLAHEFPVMAGRYIGRRLPSVASRRTLP